MKQKPISDVSQASQTARTERRLLWRPSTDSMQQSNMMRFLQAANTEYELQLESFTDLYRWSVDKLEDFWSLFWDWSPIRCERRFDEVVDNQYKMPGARWFRGAVLNYAENILGSDRNERPAIIFRGENRYHSEISRKELWSLVTRFAEALRDNGIVPGDVVAAYMPNIPETVIGMLAAAAVGAVWCSCATDIGPQAASERLGQVNPKILLTTDGYC
jgi:acetoacetyl-CoA synthetase